MELTVEGIGNRIKERRKALGLTQRALADMVGIGSDVVSKHEHERLGVGSDTLMAYAKALKTSAEALAGDASPSVFISHSANTNVMALRNAQAHGLSQVPMELARFLSDGRCNPITDEEIAHLTRHVADGNSTELTDLEIHLLAYRAERDRTDESVVKFRAAVQRARKQRGQRSLEPGTQTAPVTRKKPELTQ